MYSSIEGCWNDILEFQIIEFNESPNASYVRPSYYATKLVVNIGRAALLIVLLLFKYAPPVKHMIRQCRVREYMGGAALSTWPTTLEEEMRPTKG